MEEVKKERKPRQPRDLAGLVARLGLEELVAFCDKLKTAHPRACEFVKAELAKPPSKS